MSRSDRQNFLGESSDQILSGLKVGIVGLGGGGSHIVQQLAHVGVGEFVLIDPDRVEDSNLNRLVGGTASDAQREEWKTNVSLRVISSVNPAARVSIAKDKWQHHAELLRDCDVIFGCLDTFGGRLELEATARRFLVPYIDIGMDVSESSGGGFVISGQIALSLPDEVCLRCMNVVSATQLFEEAANYGNAGDRPQVVWPNGALASAAVGMMMGLVTPWHRALEVIFLLEYDGSRNEVTKSSSASYLEGRICRHFSGINDLGDPWLARISTVVR